MPFEVTDPYYLQALAMVRRTVMDALDGRDLNELVWLFSPLAQLAIQRATGQNEEGALTVTRRAVASLAKTVQDGDGERLRHFISQKAYIVLQDWPEEDG